MLFTKWRTLMHCHSCGTELPVGAAFCPTCGVTTLSSDSGSGVSPSNPTIASSTPSTPPRESPLPPTQLASPFYGVPQKNPYEQPLPYTDTPPPPPLLRTHIVGRTVLSLFFYLWGVFWLILGLVGGILHGTSSTIIGLIFVFCCVVGLVILILLLRSRKHFRLIPTCAPCDILGETMKEGEKDQLWERESHEPQLIIQSKKSNVA